MDLTTQLRFHAGFAPEAGRDVPSLADALGEKGSIASSVNDVIALLQLLNHEANGLVPSAAVAGQKEDFQFSRQLIYAITQIIDLLREADTGPDSEAGRAGRHVAFAWSYVLAGDIDDIRKEIARHEAARA